MIKPCDSCLKSGTPFCLDCEYEAMKNLLILAKEALIDLGACNDPECQETGCNHALVKINELLGE